MSWTLRSDVVFLNHGSFGATPASVQRAQRAIRDALESEPVDFFLRHYGRQLDMARERLAAFLGADPADLVFVDNATTGVATALAAATLAPGDGLLLLDHGYPACRNAAIRVAEARGATVQWARLPIPLPGAEDSDESATTRQAADTAIIDAVLAAVTATTRLAVLDQITSPSALVLPIDALVKALRARGVETIVDAAHAPGMIPLALDATGAAFTTGNLHKWLCAPKGAAFLHIRRDLQADADGELRVRPLVTSHGDRGPTLGRSRLHATFDWCGTRDPSPWLSIPAALDAVRETHPEGWTQRMAANHALVLQMRTALRTRIGLLPLAPPSHLGAMAAMRLPEHWSSAIAALPDPQPGIDRLQDALFRSHRVEVPIIPEPGSAPGTTRYLRVSAQAYNSVAQIDALADALGALLGRDVTERGATG